MSIKQKSWVNAKNPNEARMLAVDSIPDNSLRIKGKNLQEFLVDCFMSKPSRFPLILLTGNLYNNFNVSVLVRFGSAVCKLTWYKA